MSDTVDISRVCTVRGAWDHTQEEDSPKEAVEVYVGLEEEQIYISRYKQAGLLIFTLNEWQAINNFIREELEKNAETNS